jgi:site-specific recombinase XerC
MILALLDGRPRDSEFVVVPVNSVDVRSGAVTVLGKGHKQRTVRFGAKTLQAIIKHLATRRTCTVSGC